MTNRRPAEMNDEIDSSVRRHKISDETKDKIAVAIDEISNTDTKESIREIAHILTGDDRFDADSGTS